MISLEWMFYLLILFFGLIGAIRGWQTEIIAMAGLLGSIAALNSFGYPLANAIQLVLTSEASLDIQFFWVQFVFHIVVAFFSYQVIARLADRAPGAKFGDRLRVNFQRRFIGGCLGGINGYLLVGGLWCFLEFRLTLGGYERLAPGVQYFFSPEVVQRPLITDPTAFDVVSYLPFAMFSPAIWLVFFFISFFIVIIALI